MSASPGRDEDQVRWFVRHVRTGAPQGGCPDENLLVGWAERRLDAKQTEALDAHLADCDACREAALSWREAAVSSAGPTETGAAASAGHGTALRHLPGGRRARWAAFAAAAGVLIALGVRFAGRDGGTSAGGDARLVAAAKDLSRAHPDLFADFSPVAKSERDALADDPLRAGLSIEEPVGLLLDVPTRASFTTAPATREVRLVVVDRKGAVVWSATATGTEVEIPAHAGIVFGERYVLELAADGPVGTSTVRRSFAVATEAERAQWARAAATIRAEAPATIAEVLVAHAAVRRGFLSEALRVAEARIAARPDDPDASAIRDHARRSLRSGDTGR